MSFDLFFYPARFRDELDAGGRINPFTGKPMPPRHPGLSMTDAEYAAVCARLRAAGAPEALQEGFVLELADGARAEVASVSPDGMTLFLRRGITPGLARLLFEVASAGNMFLEATMENGCVVVSEEQASVLTKYAYGGSDHHANVCASPEAFFHHLGGGFEDWDEVRRSV